MREPHAEERVEIPASVRHERNQIETYTHTNTYSFQCPSWWKILTLSQCQRIQTSDTNPGNEAALILLQAESLISCGICPLKAGTKNSDECEEAEQQQPPPIILPMSSVFPLQLILSLACHDPTANAAPFNPWLRWVDKSRQITWWEALKGLSLPVVTPPDKTTAFLGDANETYPAKGGNPKGCRVASPFLGKSDFLPEAEEKVCYTSWEEFLMGQSPQCETLCLLLVNPVSRSIRR